MSGELKTMFAMIFPCVFLMLLRSTSHHYMGRLIMHYVSPGMSLLTEVVFLFSSYTQIDHLACFLTSGIDPHTQGGVAGRHQVVCRLNNILSMLVSLLCFKNSLAYRIVNSLESVHITHTHSGFPRSYLSFFHTSCLVSHFKNLNLLSGWCMSRVCQTSSFQITRSLFWSLFLWSLF